MTESQIELHGRGGSAAAENLQESLEANGGAGQSQYFTPHAFGKLCAHPLPQYRQTIVDLTGGNGALAIAASNASTETILLSDIENVRTRYEEGYPKPKSHRIAGDLGGIFPLMKEIDFSGDLIVLNPPFSLKWKKESFAKLAESDLETVRRAFTMAQGEFIDSTIMTLMAALDLCSTRGEGVLLANDDTLQRLIFDEDAPFHLLETHIWARAVIRGNPCTGEIKQCWDKEKDFSFGVVYFAPAHDMGLSVPHKMDERDVTHQCQDLAEFEKAVEQIALGRSRLRTGADIRASYYYTEGQAETWKAIRSEWEVRQGKRTSDFNIWLTPSGTISTYLSFFDAKNVKIPKDEAASLFKLNGKRPMELAMMRDTRQLLLHHCNGSIWRVDPSLKKAVEDAVAAYHAVRSPLMPLNDIMSLAYLDEEDWITCKADVYAQDLIQK